MIKRSSLIMKELFLTIDGWRWTAETLRLLLKTYNEYFKIRCNFLRFVPDFERSATTAETLAAHHPGIVLQAQANLPQPLCHLTRRGLAVAFTKKTPP